ncbi:cell division protein FtsQ/DivIB [Comamonas odontotermitis]|uniref:cell division protein FtsQ/DivIB n=1 Tax=Comamonas odontotermitis TaxID=379895 RepID=UPI001CC36AB3|nr:FtsQ-type POTRA domain-containing protein [Comamonas odontotermitis]UBB17662.1 FtsQ-type POTRA domain-containing protein [Comamonas odontotermitis]
MEQTMPVPFDVRLMNMLATALFVGCGAMVLAAGARWAIHHPALSIARIVVQGEMEHNSAVSLQANVMPALKGNFFTMDLDETRKIFEQAPWVRQAQVRREFPHTLSVTITEQDAAAVWGAEGESRLLNSDGQMFEGDSTDPDLHNLPHLSGRAGRSMEVLGMFRALAPIYAKLDNPLVALDESSSGSWKATLQSGAVIEMGQGTETEVRQRVSKFAESLPEVTGMYKRSVASLTSADLRHAGGYAVRMQGVSTGSTSAARPAPKK